MARQILTACSNSEGSPYYRILQPSKYFDPSELQVHTRQLLTNKFSGVHAKYLPSTVRHIIGTAWDRLKLLERRIRYSDMNNFDAVWICRSVLSFPNKIDFSARNIIYDFDDAIWSSEAKHCFERYCSLARVVFAGNQYLADRASKNSSKVMVVPTSVELASFDRSESKPKQFTVGWIGSSAGYRYLVSIEHELLAFFESYPDARLLIVSERYPIELRRLRRSLDFVQWSRSVEYSVTGRISVGIMPLNGDEWDKGKCSYKMLHYMGAEIPVVVSDFGMNSEVLKHEIRYGTFGTGIPIGHSWSDALASYHNMSETGLEAQGAVGYQVVRDHYATEVIARKILEGVKLYL